MTHEPLANLERASHFLANHQEKSENIFSLIAHFDVDKKQKPREAASRADSRPRLKMIFREIIFSKHLRDFKNDR